eukprot:10704557-Prorocentrum_lima.AAC.1
MSRQRIRRVQLQHTDDSERNWLQRKLAANWIGQISAGIVRGNYAALAQCAQLPEHEVDVVSEWAPPTPE